MKTKIEKEGKDFSHIKVLVYPKTEVTEEILLFCKSTSCNGWLMLSPIFNVSENALFFSFLGQYPKNVKLYIAIQNSTLMFKTKLTLVVYVVS